MTHHDDITINTVQLDTSPKHSAFPDDSELNKPYLGPKTTTIGHNKSDLGHSDPHLGQTDLTSADLSKPARYDIRPDIVMDTDIERLREETAL